MKVVVTGSLGNISKPLAAALAQKHSVTVITSKQDKQKDIEALGATAAVGSMEDVNFLVSTFAGADAVYAMVPPNFAVPNFLEFYQTVAKNYKQAIEQSHVGRVVLLSSLGADLDKDTGVIVGAHHMERILSEMSSDVNLTILRPTLFYTNFLPLADLVKKAGIMGNNYAGDDLIAMVSPRDIAEVAAEEIQTPSGMKIRYVTSDEYTPNQVASAVGAAIGKPDLKWVFFTDDQTQKSMEDNGLPAHIATLLVGIGNAVHKGILMEDYNKHKPVFGKVKLEEFAKEFAAAF